MSNKSWELQSIKKEYEIAKRYKENPELLTQNIIFRTGVIGVFFFFTLGVSSGLFMLVVMDYKNTIMQLLFEESVTRDLEIEILGGLILFFATIWLILLGIVLLFMLLDFRREKQHIESFAEYEKEALKKIEELENIVLKQ
jgi:hypothetical protein